ncbi:MAG: ATP-binding protein [Verrucomicrobia bacterium]|nr:ATP-binding protein [Verrucomicrobiota bacterium]
MSFRRRQAIGFVVFLGLAGLVALRGEAETGVASAEGAIRSWSVAEGLPADSVTAIIQTRDGYLWVGTSAGLVRFDGVRFTAFPLPGVGENTAVRVTALCEDAAGSLWVGTQQEGLFRREAAWSRQFSRHDGLHEDGVTSLAADAAGNLWIGTRSGLNRWDGHAFTSFTSRDGLADQNISGVHVARSGAVWITTRSGMYRFLEGRLQPYEFQTDSQGRRPEFLGAYEDRRGNLWAFGDTYLINLAEGKRFNYFRGAEAAAVRIWSLCEGRDGRLWIGTSGRGLFCFDDNKFQPVTLSELRWPYDVRVIYEDREGNLWLGTSGGGLIQLRPQTIHTVRAEQGLPPGAATCFAVDASGRVYVAPATGGVFVGEAGRFERFNPGGGFELQSVVTTLWAGPDDTLWIGTLGDGLYGVRQGRAMHLTTAHGLGDNTVLTVCTTTNGNVWLGTRAGTVHQFTDTALHNYDREHGLPGSPITALLPAWDGGLWLGTQDGLLLRGEAERFEVVPMDWPVAHRPILSLHESGRASLWVGSDGAGVACRLGQRWRVWNGLSGLPHDVVAGVSEDSDGNIWLATGAGISRVVRTAIREAMVTDIPLPARRALDSKLAFGPLPTFGWPRVVRSPDGKLWFATPQGVLTLNPRGAASEAAPLPVHVETVSVNGQPLSALPRASGVDKLPVRLPLELRVLDIEFTALSLAAPEELSFRHKLEGFDSDWVEAGPERRVHYSRLPYGQYQFRVAARKADGVWTEAAAPFAFIVPTPLYLTSWAIGLYVVLVAGLMVGAIRVVSHRRFRHALARLEQQQSLERERMRIAQDMHDEIGSKLSKISFVSEHLKVDVAPSGPLADKIESIASTSRELLQTLDEIVWAVNPRNDNLEQLADYLGQYALEYFQSTSVECELRLPRKLPHHPLSAELRHNLFLTFEEALNNVLKHSGASKVKVEMTLAPARFEINLTDNGRGFAAAAALNPPVPGPRGQRVGNGLLNMRQRLAAIGGRCLVESRSGEGTTVRLHIPMNGNPLPDS